MVHLVRRQIPATHMGSEAVISINSLMHHWHSRTVSAEGTLQLQFCFQYPIDPFCHGIVIRTAALCHTDGNVMVLQHLHIGITTVLYPSVRVMNEGSLFGCVLQGSYS